MKEGELIQAATQKTGARQHSPWESPRIKLVEVRLVAEPRVLYQVLSGPRDVARLVRDLIGSADREHFIAVYLDSTHAATHAHTVSVGTLSSSLVHPREVFKGALLANAQALVVGHNLPSGNLTPSKEDRLVDGRLREVGQVLGIELLDSIIVCSTRCYFSFADDSIGTLEQ